MNTVLELLQSLPDILGPTVATLFGLIALDLLLGIAVGVRTKSFEWTKVTNFYQTNVIPYGIAALAVAVAAQFISAEVLPGDLVDEIASIGTLIGVGPMFAHLLLGSILPNARALALGKFKWQVANPEWDLPWSPGPKGMGDL